MYFFRYWLLLTALFLTGCGSGGSDASSAPSSALPVAAKADYNYGLNAGWNAVAFQAPVLSALTGDSSILGAAYWNGTQYSFTGFTAQDLNLAGIRRGFWVYCAQGANFAYTGDDDGAGVYADLTFNGYQLVSFCTAQDLPGAQLKARQNNADVPLSSVVLTTFYEVGPDNQYTPVDITAGGVLKAGRAYWVYALVSNGAVRLFAGAPPAASPTPTPTPLVPVATQLRFLATPANVTAGVPFAVTVQAVDGSNNLVPATAGTVTLGLNGFGSLRGVTSLALSGGQATFTQIQASAAARGVSLTASLTGLANATTGNFTVAPELVSRQNDTAAGVGADFGQTVAESGSLGSQNIMSADGRYLVFASTGSPTQIWLRDRQTGTTTQVSSHQGNPGMADCKDPAISADGRYVVFLSSGQFGAFFQQNGGNDQVFLRDMTGPNLVLVSRGPSANQGANNDAQHPVVANTGAVAWASAATDLPGGSMGFQVYRRLLGVNTVSLVSHKNGAAAGVGSTTACGIPVISSDGRYVAFVGQSSDVGGAVATGGAQQVYRRDMNLADGVELVSRKFGGGMLEGGAGTSNGPSISADGNRIAWQALNSPDLTNPAALNQNSPFVRDMTGGNTSLVSLTLAGTPAPFGGGLPRISADGDTVAFSSSDLGLVTPAPPAGSYGYFRKLSTGTTVLASRSATGTPAIIAGNRCWVNGDGTLAAFLTTTTGATQLGIPSIFTQLFVTMP